MLPVGDHQISGTFSAGEKNPHPIARVRRGDQAMTSRRSKKPAFNPAQNEVSGSPSMQTNIYI